MEVRPARSADAPALGRIMVESFLAAHRGQMPDEAWRKRAEEWTPEISAQGWARLLAEQAAGEQAGTVLLVAEEHPGGPIGLVLATEDERSIAQVNALYVLPDHHRRGIGRLLLRRAAAELGALGYARLRIGVLTGNLAARAFYEAMGGLEVEQRTFDEGGFLLPETVYEWRDLATLLSTDP